MKAVSTIALAALCAVFWPGTAAAQGVAGKSVRFIVAYPAGGPADVLARTLAQELSPRLGQPVIIDNRGGANGIIASELAAKAAPDGQTILLVATAHSINPTLYPKLPYDTLADFAPVSNLVSSSFVLVVHPAVAAKSVAELIALARSKPGALNFGSGGNGSPTHLAGEMLKSMAGIDMVHVPYKGMAPALTDLLGGSLTLIFSDRIVVTPHIQSGKLKPLAVTSERRSEALPDIPTMSEAGLRGYESTLWYGVLAPGKTPKSVVEKLSQEIAQSLRAPAVSDRVKAMGAEPIGNAPAQFDAQIREDIARYAKVIKAAGVRVE